MTVRLAQSFQDVQLDTAAVVSIGTFDGVHRGHRFLLEQARERAVEHGLALVVITFDPCPAVVLRPALGRYQINTAAQKLRLLDDLDASMILLLPFTPELSQLTADQFMDEIEKQLRLKELWFGEDFRFGHRRGGDLEMLVERSHSSRFALHVVSRRTEGEESISSSRIRRVIAGGDVEGAIPLLGYPFRLDCSHVAPGNWAGGGPGAECSFIPYQLLPADGAYAVLTASGAQTLAIVTASNPESQLLVKGDDLGSSFEVEFIRRLASAEQYASDPARWDEIAHDSLSQWRRPVYAPISEY